MDSVNYHQSVDALSNNGLRRQALQRWPHLQSKGRGIIWNWPRHVLSTNPSPGWIPQENWPTKEFLRSHSCRYCHQAHTRFSPDDISQSSQFCSQCEHNTWLFVRKAVPFQSIDSTSFSHHLESLEPAFVLDGVDQACSSLADTHHSAALEYQLQETFLPMSSGNNTEDQWQTFIDSNNSQIFWKALGLNGNLCDWPMDMPSDKDFQTHFQSLLYHEDRGIEVFQANNLPHIPGLDASITLMEYG